MLKTVQLTLLVAGAAAIPWLFGGNLPFVRLGLLCGIALLLLLQCVGQLVKLCRQRELKQGAGGNFFGAFLILAGVWIGMPAISGWALGGGGAPIFTEIPRWLGTWGESIYLAATRERWIEYWLAVGVFFASRQILAGRRQLHVFCTAIAANGAALSFFGIVQRSSWDGRIFWAFPLDAGDPFASFVNSNNAGGYLLLCLAAAVFVVIDSGRGASTGELGRSGKSDRAWGWAEIREGLWGLLADLNALKLLRTASIVLIVGGIIGTLSKSAILALGCCALSLLVWLAWYRRWWIAPLAGLSLCGLALAFFLIQPQQFARTWQSMVDLDHQTDSRVMHWQDAVRSTSESMWTGHGLGTYRYAYMEFHQGREFQGWFQHAENQFVEAYVENGVVGLALLMFAIFWFLLIAVRLARSDDKSLRTVGLMGMILLVGQGLSACFDFGLYQPANLCLMASLVAGCFAATQSRWNRSPFAWAQSTEDHESVTGNPASRARGAMAGGSLAVGTLLTMGLLLILGRAMVESSAVETRKSANRRLVSLDPLANSTPRKLERTQSELEYVLRWRPDDSEAHLLMARVHELGYRLDLWQQLLGSLQTSPRDISPETRTELWLATDLGQLHRVAASLVRVTEGNVADDADWRSIRTNPAFEEHLVAAWQQFQEAERHCNRVPVTLYSISLLSPLFEYDRADLTELTEQRIHEAIRRCPESPHNLFGMGQIAVNWGRQDLASELFAKSLGYSRDYEQPIVELALSDLPWKTFVEQVVPDDPEMRVRIARKYLSRPGMNLPRRMLLNHTKQWLERQPETENLFWLAEVQALLGDAGAAQTNYREAAHRLPEDLPIRMAYIESLLNAEAPGEYAGELKQQLAAARRLVNRETPEPLARRFRSAVRRHERLMPSSPAE